MAFEEGDRHRCPESKCGCEILVTRGAAPGRDEDRNPTCCCGLEMVKLD